MQSGEYEFTGHEVTDAVANIIANVQEENGVLLDDMTADELRTFWRERVLDYTATI